ncbi:MarR family winged helix-turn-helix transcriptional regulator [Silvibacterium acidisoli]|uniref:MarR family winged helix-turn-helix transcriptional regulator n=1 Tax=Acidobacteriaceae bacterium ZG23-2 TaxID=2883246 RepID=UPI00406D3AB1
MDKLLRSESELAPTLASDIRAIAGKLRRRLRDQGGKNDFTPSQVDILLRLEKDGPATIASLARADGVRHQSMSAAIGPLQEAGLIQGARDPRDGRQTLMSLTPKCLKWLRESRAAKQDWLTRNITEKLSIREQERLRSALELLARLVED